MTERLVVCFRWHEKGTTPEAYLRAVDRVFERVEREGAASIAWSTNSYCFALPPTAFANMLRAALDLLRERATHGVGFAQRTLFADGAGRRMGPALVVAETLAASTRSGELLIDSHIEAVERGELTAVGSLRFDVAGQSVSAALMVAASASASGFAPSVRKDPSASRPPSEHHADELMLHFDDGAWDTVTPPRASLYPVAAESAAAETPGGSALDLYEDDSLFSDADEPTNPGSLLARATSAARTDPRSADAQPVDFRPVDFGSVVPTRVGLPRPEAPIPPRPRLPSVEAASPAPSSRLSTPPPKPKGRPSSVSALSPAALPVEARHGGAPPSPPLHITSPPRLVPPLTGANGSAPSRLSTPPPKPSRLGQDRPSSAQLTSAEPQAPSVSHIAALAGDEAKSMLRVVGDLWSDEKDDGLQLKLKHLISPTSRDLEVALNQLQAASEGHPIEDPAGRARVAFAYSLCLAQAGKPADALLESLQALTSARRAGDDPGTSACEMLLAELARYTGQPQLAERWLRIPKLFSG